ncbi:hypothetical protein L1887_50621 [Cichorium endivia]|nr:hypothetical protein L1887_50621 [Cichorium endivia]
MQPADALGKVDPDAAVVDEHVLHLEVGAFGVVLLVELDKGVLERVASLFVLDHLARHNPAEAREDELQILAARDRIELAHKEDVLGRADLGKGEVADHFERQRSRVRVGIASLLLLLCLVALFAQHHDVSDADILERPLLIIRKCGVDLVERATGLLPFDHRSERYMLAIQILDVVLERDKELRTCQQRHPLIFCMLLAADTCKGDSALAGMLERLFGVRLEQAAVEPVARRGGKLRPDAGATFARVGRIARLRQKVLLHAEEGVELVEVLGAQLEEVGAGARRRLGVQGRGVKGPRNCFLAQSPLFGGQTSTRLRPSDITHDNGRARQNVRVYTSLAAGARGWGEDTRPKPACEFERARGQGSRVATTAGAVEPAAPLDAANRLERSAVHDHGQRVAVAQQRKAKWQGGQPQCGT